MGKRTTGLDKIFDFDDIRPYDDGEVNHVLMSMMKEPIFHKLSKFIWPTITEEELLAKARKVKTSLDFQHEFMDQAIWTLVDRYSDGLTFSGFEKLDPKKSYLFVANHRDIVLDSAILQILLFKHGHQTSEITFGSNLMDDGFITHFGRLNRMFTVFREGTSKELYEISRKLSAYIRHTIIDKNTSVWIAQRNGRTKDGNDLTQSGLLKMMNISGIQSFHDNFRELNLTPLSISYEYDPCDNLKTQELYLSSLHSNYKKASGEDLNSILTGVTQSKGRIHLAVGDTFDKELDQIGVGINENEKFRMLTSMIDKQIYKNYKIWPVNFIAADLLDKSEKFNQHYTKTERDNFVSYIDKSVSKLEGERDSLEQLLVKLYANPLFNK